MLLLGHRVIIVEIFFDNSCSLHFYHITSIPEIIFLKEWLLSVVTEYE